MSFRISLSHKGDWVRDMNWLRNPFGLAEWIEGNVERCTNMTLSGYLGFCNGELSHRVSRATFQYYVLQYAEQVRKLENGHFRFDLPAYRQFIEGRQGALPGRVLASQFRIEGERYNREFVNLKGGGMGEEVTGLDIPMEHFIHREFNLGIYPRWDATPHDRPVLRHYKAWTEELVGFAALLQNEDYDFYCEA